jgi:MFS family permease
MSALTTGLLMLAAAAGNVGTKSITTTVVRRFGFRTLLSRNSLLIAAGMFLCMLIGHDTPLWAIALLLLAIGITRSLQFTGISTLTYADIPPERLSAATSLASTAQQLAIGIGIALAAVLLRLAAFSHRASMQQHTLGDFRIAFCALGVVALLQMVAFSRLAPDAGDLVSGSRRAAVPQGMSGKL